MSESTIVARIELFLAECTEQTGISQLERRVKLVIEHIAGFTTMDLHCNVTSVTKRPRTVAGLEKLMLYKLLLSVFIIVFSCACQALEPRSDLAWAVNVGGPLYKGVDGTDYAAETSVTGGKIGQIEVVRGADDEVLYQTYREGDVRVAHSLPDGVYDVTLHFAEPNDSAIRERLFDVYIEGEQVFHELDVILLRDGNANSALTVTHRNIEISDGLLDVQFEPVVGQPILSGLVVRRKKKVQEPWQLVWRDEFELAGAPNPALWSVREWPARVVNSEDQAYTMRSRNVRVEEGKLILEAHREDYGEAKYTSARVLSQGKGDFLYGRFEARARLPEGMGTWAAIWMLPSDPFTYATTCDDDENWQGSEDCDAWPNSGEIDILEHVGYQPGHIHGTVHTRDYFFINQQQRKGRILVDDESTEFQLYALEWSPERIDIFVNDVLYFTFVNGQQGWTSWPFDQSFYLIMNLAIGGDWGRAGGAIDDSIFPQRMEVDYIRVYEKAQ